MDIYEWVDRVIGRKGGGRESWLVLRDIWKDFIECDGVKVPIEGGFRGFREVPPGKHTLKNYGVTLEVDLQPGEVQVHILKSQEKEFIRMSKEDDDFGFHELAKAGAMDGALRPWPSSG
ncbi:hypothetical protein FSP39_012166 [Pinctada imbricata]|uniref:Uncharacterized protein n=1 Tax=Pinctada imbricata TaxID=66713 RepID=A0AA88XZQ4_PINIB|nr:hypothetical protein FSP39_012166 [Pinctada imbricata]